MNLNPDSIEPCMCMRSGDDPHSLLGPDLGAISVLH